MSSQIVNKVSHEATMKSENIAKGAIHKKRSYLRGRGDLVKVDICGLERAGFYSKRELNGLKSFI